jgi:transcriptional regulator with XRE-family HTH domain
MTSVPSVRSVSTQPFPPLAVGRRAKRLTQMQLAVRSGVSIDTIRRIEQGRRERVSQGTWTKLCDALGVEGLAGVQQRDH